MKIALYLMTKKGFKVLESIIKCGYTNLISQVIIGKDSNIDHDFSDEITSLCISNSINYKDRNSEINIKAPYSITVSWRWIITENNSKLIILHDSLLPKYRGFAPLVNMLINKESLIGVSAIFATNEYDKGDIIAQSSTKIEYPLTISKAIDLITLNYIELLTTIFENISQGNELKATPQNESQATYSLWRNEDDYAINWNQSSDQILNFINAVSSPYKGASAKINDKKVRILAAEIVPDVSIENRHVGKVIFIEDKFPIIVCKKGLLKITEIIDNQTRTSILPFKNFRIRLT